jgi:DNA-binding MarR family transcriptional regulator
VAALRALQSLERRGPSLVTELGEDLDMLPSTASGLSDRLTEDGLITRRVSPSNRRATLLELTDAGAAVLDELIARRTRALTEVEHMSPEELDALIRSAQAFTDARMALRAHD